MSSSSSSSSSYVENWSSSSSSSSSYLDQTGDRTIPFIIEIEESNPVLVMSPYKDDVYAGTGKNGILLKTSDRVFWSQEHSMDDTGIKALLAQNDTLFIGTYPQGKIYTLDLLTNELTLSQEMGGQVYGFAYYKNGMYVAAGSPARIYKYNDITGIWDSIYDLPSQVVNKMLITNDKLYVFMDYPEFISFDGRYWILESGGSETVSSVRNVVKEPYVDGQLITRSNVKSVSYPTTLDPEIVYDIFPLNYSKGLKSADADGEGLILGTSTYGKVYNYFDNTFYPIFLTESANTVHYLLNISTGVNLASIDNKVYLIYCGDIITSTITTEATTTTTTLPSVVNVTFPISGESFQMGETVTITWTSTKGLNDAISIDLYKNGELDSSINPNTANNGSYEWVVPSSIVPGFEYSIVITWLTAGSTNESNSGHSGNFALTYPQEVTTTTTSTVTQAYDLPDVNHPVAIPLLDLGEDEYVTYMMKDEADGGILFSTSKGRVLGCREALINAYLTGERNVYAEVVDGFGNVSDTAFTTLFYSLYHKIAEINEYKEVEKWKFEYDSTAIPNDRITGIFLSPIIYVKNDLVSWKQLIWSESKPTGTEIIICIRSADSLDELKLLSWDYCYTSRDSDRGYGSTGLIVRDLNDYHTKGKYIQFKVTTMTDSVSVTPTIVSLTLSYSTKFAVYFFTTKFALTSDTNTKSGLMVASITEPQNTEIQFGISNVNSADWNDYEIVDLNKFFSLNDYDRIKVGIKMIAYDTNIPEVAEFSLMSGSEKNNLMNE